jgi:hypothetical protein
LEEKMNPRLHVTVVLCCLVALGAAACSGKNDPPPTPTPDAGTPGDVDAGPDEHDAGSPCDGGVYDADAGTCVVEPEVIPTAQEEFEQKFLETWCAYLDRCDLDVRSLDTCVAAQKARGHAFNSVPMNMELLADGKTTYNGKQATLCLDAIPKVACNTPVKSQVSLPECQRVFTGQGLDSSTCVTDGQCGEGLFCLQVKSGSTPVCAGSCRPRGLRCEVRTDCAEGQTCTESQFCVKAPVDPGELNEPCGTDDLCSQKTRTLACVEDDGGVRTCQQAPRQGSRCDVHRQCAEGYVCRDSGESGQAVPTCFKRAVAAVGEACDIYTPASCSPGLVCVLNTNGANCQAPKKLGESCTDLYDCGGVYSTLMCDSATSKCVQRPHEGACPKQGDASLPMGCDVLSSFCDQDHGQVCAAFRAEGDACAADLECGPYWLSPRCTLDQVKGYNVCHHIVAPVCP